MPSLQRGATGVAAGFRRHKGHCCPNLTDVDRSCPEVCWSRCKFGRTRSKFDRFRVRARMADRTAAVMFLSARLVPSKPVARGLPRPSDARSRKPQPTAFRNLRRQHDGCGKQLHAGERRNVTGKRLPDDVAVRSCPNIFELCRPRLEAHATGLAMPAATQLHRPLRVAETRRRATRGGETPIVDADLQLPVTWAERA